MHSLLIKKLANPMLYLQQNPVLMLILNLITNLFQIFHIYWHYFFTI